MRKKILMLWPFVWLLCVWIYVVFPFSSTVSIDVGESNQIFTALLILHAGVYILDCLQIVPQRWHWLLVVLQNGFIVVMSLVLSSANTFIVSIALYLALIGESMSFGRRREIVTFTVISAVVSFMLGIILRGGWVAFHHAALYIVPVILVAIGYIALYFRLARANERSQALLHELEEAHDTLARYAARVEELTLTNERQRLARELHDTLAQGLAGLTMQLDAADALLSEENPREAQEIVQQAMVRSRATLFDARKAIDDLRSTDSDVRDCSKAVQEELDLFTTTTGIPCQADLTALVNVAPSFYEHVLRVVTEGLLNVARHAQAQHVWVQAIPHDDALTIEVRDDGIGYDMSGEATPPGHYGLLGLRERARLIGGRLEIESARGAGTTIRFTLPSSRGKERQHGVEARRQHGESMIQRERRYA